MCFYFSWTFHPYRRDSLMWLTNEVARYGASKRHYCDLANKRSLGSQFKLKKYDDTQR